MEDRVLELDANFFHLQFQDSGLDFITGFWISVVSTIWFLIDLAGFSAPSILCASLFKSVRISNNCLVRVTKGA